MINYVIIALITGAERNKVFSRISGLICQTFLVDITKFREMAAKADTWAF